MTSRRRRLGFITTSFPRHAGDFAGNFVYHMAEALGGAGYDVDVVVPEGPPIRDIDFLPGHPEAEWLQVHRVRYMVPPSLQTLCFGEGTPENLKQHPLLAGLAVPLIARMWQRIEQLHPRWDAVFSHWLLPSALIAPRVPRFRIPHVAIAHSGDVHLLSKLRGKSILSAAIARRCDAINFVSNQLKMEFIRCLPAHLSPPPCPLHVTPMGIPPFSCPLSKAAARQQLKLDGFAVLFVGRLSPVKGIPYLIDAMNHFNGTLLVAGGGEMKTQLEHQCRQRHINTRFFGTVSPKERDLLLRGADVLVLPSIQLSDGRHEGAPTILTEAMQAGIPVVATRTGGIPDTVSHLQNGLLVPEKDPGAIREALNFIRNQPRQVHRLTTAAKHHVQPLQWNLLIHSFIDMLNTSFARNPGDIKHAELPPGG